MQYMLLGHVQVLVICSPDTDVFIISLSLLSSIDGHVTSTLVSVTEDAHLIWKQYATLLVSLSVVR